MSDIPTFADKAKAKRVASGEPAWKVVVGGVLLAVLLVGFVAGLFLRFFGPIGEVPEEADPPPWSVAYQMKICKATKGAFSSTGATCETVRRAWETGLR